MCLNEFNRRLSHNSPDSISPLHEIHLLDSILALLLLIFKSRCSDIVHIGLEILGAAALISCEVNEKIALEESETFQVLSGSEKIALAACNSLLDVSSTSLGRQQLVDFSAINHLIIPRKLMEISVTCYRKLWAHLHEQIFDRKITHGKTSSRLTTHSMAETIFRLSMNDSHLDSAITFDVIMRRIIGADNSSYQNFMLHHWESSPFIKRRSHMDLHQCDDIFNGFSGIFRYLNEVETLASPIFYQQDIRVVRTGQNLKHEDQFFAVSDNVFTMDDILRCEKAFKEGYTIALRGMEFRLKNIASITSKVACLFGQPSVGANLYLTPPNSEGLSCHYDDHCVFVCQLRGTKLWTVSPQSLVELSCLYDCLVGPPDTVKGSREILLKEGDVLYIPRGYPHKACTFATSDVHNFSMHLTVAIEIEPPFE